MFHYTYLITYSDGKKYMGVRSCTVSPEDDVYYGSSKHTPKISEVVSKQILNVFSDRASAVQSEIEYHNKYDVARSPDYYNRSKQTASSFCTHGVHFIHTQEHREKIKVALTGRVRSKEERLACSLGKKGKKYGPHSEATKRAIGRGNRGKTVNPASTQKMVQTRKANNSYKHSESAKQQIRETLLKNPPNTQSVLFTQNGQCTEYPSIPACSRATGIGINSLKGRIQRKPGTLINGWAIERTKQTEQE